jgi:hypothetical protein
VALHPAAPIHVALLLSRLLGALGVNSAWARAQHRTRCIGFNGNGKLYSGMLRFCLKKDAYNVLNDLRPDRRSASLLRELESEEVKLDQCQDGDPCGPFYDS